MTKECCVYPMLVGGHTLVPCRARWYSAWRKPRLKIHLFWLMR